MRFPFLDYEISFSGGGGGMQSEDFPLRTLRKNYVTLHCIPLPSSLLLFPGSLSKKAVYP
jgi:hypothetical protein